MADVKPNSFWLVTFPWKLPREETFYQTIGEMGSEGDIYAPGWLEPIDQSQAQVTFLCENVKELVANIPHNVNL